MISAMTSDDCLRSVRAVRLGMKDSRSAAARTRSLRSAETVMPLKTRDTVAGETPASAATS
jgi:hypothetical protein